MTDPSTEQSGTQMERRRFLKNAAIAAWSTPLIVTMVASPAHAQTASCIPPGRDCTPQGLPCCHQSHRCRLTGAGFKCVGPPPGGNDPGQP